MAISGRFKVFLDFLNLQRTREEQAMEFLIKARQNPHGAQDNLMLFMALQNERDRRIALHTFKYFQETQSD